MKKILLLAIILLSNSFVFSQSLDSLILKKFTEAVDGRLQSKYMIKCYFADTLNDDQRKIVSNQNQWSVAGHEKVYTVAKVTLPLRNLFCNLHGDWDSDDPLTVTFIDKDNSSQTMQVNSDSAFNVTTKWGFGKGKAVDFNIRRLTDQKALSAFDYSVDVSIVERGLSAGGGSFWMKSLDLDLSSIGTIASDDEARNGTKSSLTLAAKPFYFASNLIYSSQIFVSYNVETNMNSTEDKLLDIINQQLEFGFSLEMPWTNLPIYKLHAKTGYARMAMPLKLGLSYMPKGEDGDGNDTFSRIEHDGLYELAISPYFIAQASWQYTKFFDTPEGSDDVATYFSLTIAQDFGVMKKYLGYLRLIAGDIGDPEGKNFIFYKISNGRSSPAYEDIREYSFGFGTYL